MGKMSLKASPWENQIVQREHGNANEKEKLWREIPCLYPSPPPLWRTVGYSATTESITNPPPTSHHHRSEERAHLPSATWYQRFSIFSIPNLSLSIFGLFDDNGDGAGDRGSNYNLRICANLRNFHNMGIPNTQKARLHLLIVKLLIASNEKSGFSSFTNIVDLRFGIVSLCQRKILHLCFFVFVKWKSRIVSWPGELGSSTFSSPASWGAQCRACKFQRHIFTFAHPLPYFFPGYLFPNFCRCRTADETYMWSNTRLQICSGTHLHIGLSTFWGERREVLSGGMGASRLWNWAWLSMHRVQNMQNLQNV